jgi:tetratricopeptide (TPR) repeat protein
MCIAWHVSIAVSSGCLQVQLGQMSSRENFMRIKLIHPCIGLLFWCALAITIYAQDIDSGLRSADTNNAVIEGRVTLPSGFAAERNIRITLKNSQSTLAILYSNKNGQFQINNLSAGVYFVQAEVDDASFEPVSEKVMLGRGMVWELTLELREKKPTHFLRPGSRVVSAFELHQSVPPAAKKEYELGLKLVNKGKFEQAAEHFREAMAIYPEYLAARNDLGAQYLKLNRLDEAEKHFRIVLEKDPKNFNAKFNLGLVRIERRDYLDAINKLNEAIAIDSERPIARLWLGFALLELGEYSNAERELTRAVVMGEAECVAAHYHLARIYLAQKETAKAENAIRIYLEESPKGEYAKEAIALEKKLKGDLKGQPKK